MAVVFIGVGNWSIRRKPQTAASHWQIFRFFFCCPIFVYVLSSVLWNRYDFHVKTMFGSSLPPIDLRGFISYLRYLCLCACSDVQHILCCVFVLFVFVLCALCCKFLCIVHFWFPNRYSLKLMYTTTISTHINLHHMDNSFRDPEPFESLHLTFTKKIVWSKLQSL
jgi:hypothetical protein